MADREGLLFVMMGIAPEHEEDFNRWYNEEHLPERRGCEGFINARRFEVVQGSPKYLATYDLTSVGVLDAPPYKALTAEISPWTRKIGSLLDAHTRNVYEERTPPAIAETFASIEEVDQGTALLAVIADAEPEREGEVVEWYDTEHLVERMECPGFLRARRFEAVSGEPKFLALYDLADLGALETPEYKAHQASPTKRTTETLSHLRSSRRNVYQRIA